jgi:hypothetical protein
MSTPLARSGNPSALIPKDPDERRPTPDALTEPGGVA